MARDSAASAVIGWDCLAVCLVLHRLLFGPHDSSLALVASRHAATTAERIPTFMKFISLVSSVRRCDPQGALASSASSIVNRSAHPKNFLGNQEITMAWTTPAATDLRFGFEITMYIANR